MIAKAKVSHSAVSAFKNAVAEAVNYSPEFNSGFSCLNELCSYLHSEITRITEVYPKLIQAQKLAETKIKSLEDQIAALTEQYNSLKSELADVKAELAITSSTITEYDSEGNSYEVANPRHQELKSDVKELGDEIFSVQSKINECQQHLGYSNRLHSEIIKQADLLHGIEHSLNEKTSECLRLKSLLEEAKNFNSQKSRIVFDKLNHIEQLIKEYLDVKLQLETSLFSESNPDFNIDKLLNINITINAAPQQGFVNDTEHIKSDSQPIQEKIDDNGNVYRIGNKLVANNTFKVNDYTYKTDNEGRTISVSGKLTLNELGQENRKMTDKIEIIGQGEQLETDDRGHLIGHQFNGMDSLGNLVPQDYRVNRGEFRLLEEKLAVLIRNGSKVNTSVIPFYNLNSKRPSGIFYFYNIDGTSNIRLFPNETMEGLE